MVAEATHRLAQKEVADDQARAELESQLSACPQPAHLRQFTSALLISRRIAAVAQQAKPRQGATR